MITLTVFVAIFLFSTSVFGVIIGFAVGTVVGMIFTARRQGPSGGSNA